MRSFIRLFAAACCAIAAFSAGPGNAEKRVAVVIGNAGNKAGAELPNPRKDAGDVAVALKAAAFVEAVRRRGDRGQR